MNHLANVASKRRFRLQPTRCNTQIVSWRPALAVKAKATATASVVAVVGQNCCSQCRIWHSAGQTGERFSQHFGWPEVAGKESLASLVFVLGPIRLANNKNDNNYSRRNSYRRLSSQLWIPYNCWAFCFPEPNTISWLRWLPSQSASRPLVELQMLPQQQQQLTRTLCSRSQDPSSSGSGEGPVRLTGANLAASGQT